jgi:hypothetical protein
MERIDMVSFSAISFVGESLCGKGDDLTLTSGERLDRRRGP